MCARAKAVNTCMQCAGILLGSMLYAKIYFGGWTHKGRPAELSPLTLTNVAAKARAQAAQGNNRPRCHFIHKIRYGCCAQMATLAQNESCQSRHPSYTSPARWFLRASLPAAWAFIVSPLALRITPTLCSSLRRDAKQNIFCH